MCGVMVRHRDVNKGISLIGLHHNTGNALSKTILLYIPTIVKDMKRFLTCSLKYSSKVIEVTAR